MIKKFYSITLVDDNETVKITPNNLYVITDEITPNIVVMYEIAHFQNSDLINPKMISRIPYYISDGRTNNLRANMLYPFGCFSKYGSKYCPFNMLRPESKILIKYSFFKNINTTILELELIKYFLERGYPRVNIIHDESSDLSSVLSRLGNLLDFTICIMNDIIINFNCVHEDEFINQGKYSPFNNEQVKMNLDYTDMTIYGLGSEIFKKKTKDSYDFDNNFRSVLLTVFHLYSNLFISSNVIQLNTISLQENFINIDSFNIIANVCNKEYASNNMFNYIEISTQFKKIFLNRINFLEIDIEQKDKLKAIIDLSEQQPFTPETAYRKFRTNFNVSCTEFREGYIPDTHDISEMTKDQLLHEIELLDIKLKTYERFQRWTDYTKRALNEIEKQKSNEKKYKAKLIDFILHLRTLLNSENTI
jgi:hypothetical protein